ncbi:MAG TPA: outer membrane protein assembly factor BamE [Thermoanaerobaculia bacterium]|jgi:hypothetical protein
MTGKRSITVLASFVAIAVLSATCVVAAAYHVQRSYDLYHPTKEDTFTRITKSMLSPVGEVLFPMICPERTRYASAYREEAFRSVKPGMTEHDVQRSLGEPLLRKTFPDGETVWYYSKQSTERDNYFVRNIVFDQRGRVVRCDAEFYMD